MPGERTEQATPHRREQARKDGDLLVSRELTSAASLLAGAIALGVGGPAILVAWTTAYIGFLELGRPQHWEEATLMPTINALRRLSLNVLLPTGMIAFAVAGAALFVAMAQAGGVSLHPTAISFKLDRINPLTNLKNLFSLRAAARLAKSLLPASLVVALAVQQIGGQLRLPPFSIERLNGLGHEVYSLLLAAALVLFGWAAVDYVVEWQSREKRLKMSREDLRQEMRDTEGNPQIRGRIRNLQRQMRRRRVKADVSRAAVVITNPTHYAVALSFDFVTMEAPKILAKGRDLLAEEIKEEARWAGVPILENPPLARSLYRLVEVGQSIPVDLYATVASILAYLYRQRVEAELRTRRAREMREREAADGVRKAAASRRPTTRRPRTDTDAHQAPARSRPSGEGDRAMTVRGPDPDMDPNLNPNPNPERDAAGSSTNSRTKAPAADRGNRLGNGRGNGPGNKPGHGPGNEFANESGNESGNECANQCANQSANEPVDERQGDPPHRQNSTSSEPSKNESRGAQSPPSSDSENSGDRP